MAAANSKELTPEQQIEALKSQLAQTIEESRAKDEIVNGLTEKLAAAEVQGDGALLVLTHDGKRYQVLARQFTLDGRTVKAEQLKADAALVKELVEAKSGLLLELE